MKEGNWGLVGIVGSGEEKGPSSNRFYLPWGPYALGGVPWALTRPDQVCLELEND